MTTAEIAADFATLCKAGDWAAAGEKYWSPEIISVEPMGDQPETRGIEAVRAKGVWWYENHEVHSAETTGPFVNGDQFILRFKLDVTMKQNGARMVMNEDGLYTVRDGKIVEERFFFGSLPGA